MNRTSGLSLAALLLAGVSLFAAPSSALADGPAHPPAAHPHPAMHPGFHPAAPHFAQTETFHRPAPAHPAPGFHPGPGFHPAPGFHGAVRVGGFHPLHAAIVGRVGFAHFTPAQRAIWTRGNWYHRWYNGRFGWWWFAGGAWFWYDAPVYPYPTVVSDYYYEQPDYSQAAPYTWYYCYNPPGYYPYVQSCYGPWQPVPAQGYGQGYGEDQGGQDEGPPPDQGPNGEQGPPPGYDQGPQQGPPPGDQQDQGPPPGYEQGPPPD